MLKEFKEFAIKGNAVDLAIGVIIGSAFAKIVDSLVNDIILPPIGLIAGKVDFSSLSISLGEGTQALSYGKFINAVLNFLIIAFVIFLIVKQMNKFRKQPAASNEKNCPYCISKIDKKATKCPNCTSTLKV